MITPFSMGKIPQIHFGAGKFKLLGAMTRSLGDRILVVTGGYSLQSSGKAELLFSMLKKAGLKIYHSSIAQEPTPSAVDHIVAQNKTYRVHAVIAVGGGSVIDAGKAISAMLPCQGSVLDYLEDIGTVKPPGVKVPFIAVPTTAGTGSEATKNAVLSQVGDQGFKKSLRHANYVPDIAIVDPELTLSLPRHITAMCGMDAFSQLLESYMSTRANPMTDALALNGIYFAKESLLSLVTSRKDDIDARGKMSYAALLSGITLANAGLTVVHGMAGPMGGLFSIPHGAACGTLLAPSLRITVRGLKETRKYRKESEIFLKKLACVGRVIANQDDLDSDDGCTLLLETIEQWTETLKIPTLGDHGIKTSDVDKIVALSSNKNNPYQLTPEEMAEAIRKRL